MDTTRVALAHNIAHGTVRRIRQPAMWPIPTCLTSPTRAQAAEQTSTAWAGITIVGGHEMAETITDQFPNGGWLDSGGAEIWHKSARISSSQAAAVGVKIR